MNEKEKPAVVRIQRGLFSPYFQVARAWITAASALATVDRYVAASYIDQAIIELQALKTRMAAS